MTDLRDVEAFLYREALLVDEQRYDEWLALWTEDGIYHVPTADETGRRKVAIIRDNALRLRQRVDRLKTGSVLAVQGAQDAMRRIVSNVEILSDTDGVVEIGSNFILGIARSAEQQLWIGRITHRLSRDGSGWRIAGKTVRLINRGREMPLLQFLI